MTDALVKGFTQTLKAIVTMGKLARQISMLRWRRRERKEKRARTHPLEPATGH